MVQLNHIIVLAQSDFIDSQLRSAFAARVRRRLFGRSR